jgi:uncharacterized membrane protein YgcG
MKTLLLPLAASAMLFGSAALADTFVDGAVNNLRSLGYEYIEVTRGVTQARAEAVRGTQKIEVIYDLATGRILRQEYETAGPGYFGRSGVEIDVVRRDFLDDDDDDGSRSGRDDNDDDDDDDSRSGSGRDDNDDDNDDDGSRGGSGRDDNDDDNDDDGGRSGGSSGSSGGSGGGSGGGSNDDNDDD